METLEDAAVRLRAAVASQAYAEARGLIPAYCALLEGEFRRWPASSPEARRIAEEARELYQWLARTVVVDRAQCAAGLQRLARLSAYIELRGRPRHTYELEG